MLSKLGKQARTPTHAWPSKRCCGCNSASHKINLPNSLKLANLKYVNDVRIWYQNSPSQIYSKSTVCICLLVKTQSVCRVIPLWGDHFIRHDPPLEFEPSLLEAGWLRSAGAKPPCHHGCYRYGHFFHHCLVCIGMPYVPGMAIPGSLAKPKQPLWAAHFP